MPTDIKNLDHDVSLAAALGNMVVAWAYTEAILAGTFARICGIDINMATLGYYRIPTFEARVKCLLAFMLEWNPKKYDKDAIAKEINAISGQSGARNDWVHGLWCYDKPTNETIIFDFRRHEDKRSKPVKAADVQNHIKALLGHAEQLATLIEYRLITDPSRQQPSR
jgi:hypothetical protein